MIERFELIGGVCAVGHVKNLYITAWWGEVTVQCLEQVRAHRRVFLSQTSGPLLALSMVFQARLKMMPKESRRMVEEINAEAPERFLGEAYYVEAGGLVISTVRFVIAGIQLINKTRWPLSVFGTLDEAAQWLGSLGEASAHELLLAMQEFTRRCERFGG